MNEQKTNRRNFLRGSAVAIAGAGPLSTGIAAAAEKQSRPIRLGGPVFNAPNDPEGLALAHRKLGYRAAYCPGARLDDRERIRDISRAFAKHDVAIAEVGRWVNLLDADAAKRAANLKKVTEGLALAEAVGARCCVDMSVHFREVTLGVGALDYRTYLKRLAALPGDVPLMIEHMQGAEEYDKSRLHLFELGPKAGVRFE